MVELQVVNGIMKCIRKMCCRNTGLCRSNEAKNSEMHPFVAVKDARIADVGSRGL